MSCIVRRNEWPTSTNNGSNKKKPLSLYIGKQISRENVFVWHLAMTQNDDGLYGPPLFATLET